MRVKFKTPQGITMMETNCLYTVRAVRGEGYNLWASPTSTTEGGCQIAKNLPLDKVMKLADRFGGVWLEDEEENKNV